MYSRKSSATDIFFIFFILLIALLIRRYDAFTNPQFFTEDSTIFFQQFLDFGAKSIFRPYNGYIHLLPRLIAFTFGAMHVSYTYMPVCFNVSAFFITFFVSVSLYFGAVKLKLRNKILYATFFLFLPIGGEVFMNVTHIIWITSIYLINFLYVGYYAHQADETGKGIFLKYFKLLVILVFSLSGTCSLLVAPAVILIFIFERKALSVSRIIPLCIILFAAVVQYVLIKFVDFRKPGVWTVGTLYRYIIDLFTKNTIDVFFLYMLSPVIRYRIIFIISSLILLVFIYLFVKCYLKIANPRKYVFIIAGMTFLCSAIAIQGKDSNPTIMGFTLLHNDPARWANFDGWFTYQRYLFIPYACIAWIFILALDNVLKLWHIILYLIFTAFHYRELKNNMPDLHWKEQVEEYYQGKKDTILTNPKVWGYKVILPKKQDK